MHIHVPSCYVDISFRVLRIREDFCWNGYPSYTGIGKNTF